MVLLNLSHSEAQKQESDGSSVYDSSKIAIRFLDQCRSATFVGCTEDIYNLNAMGFESVLQVLCVIIAFDQRGKPLNTG
jgi:hypothetical protein